MTALAVFARIGERHVAFDAASVEAVIDLGDVIPVPLAASHIRGLAAVRSQVLTVVDVEAALAGCISDPSRRRALLVSRDKHHYALLIDAVEEVAVPSDISAHVPPGLTKGWSRAARGTVQLGQTLALNLDIGAIIAPAD